MTIDLLDSTCMLLHREYPKQQSTNLAKAKKIKKALETEQISIQDNFRDIKTDIGICIIIIMLKCIPYNSEYSGYCS